MIKIEKVRVTGFDDAIRSMRNPLESWHKSDTIHKLWMSDDRCVTSTTSMNLEGLGEKMIIGPNDLDLMKRLCKAGTDHRKFLRMITVYMDITANHVFWSEFDTYKISTVRNSCSKMHKIHVHNFTEDMFDHEGIDECGDYTRTTFEVVIGELERLRCLFNETHEKKYWRALLELLPMGFRLKATVMLNYEVLANMFNGREHHKWLEWRQFCEFIKTLPYSELITEYCKRSKPGEVTKEVLEKAITEMSLDDIYRIKGISMDSEDDDLK